MRKQSKSSFRRTATVAGGFRSGRRVAGPGCGARTTHGSADSALLLGSELEDVVHQEFCLILVVAMERSGRRAGKNPVAAFALEEAGWHGGARADSLGVDDPTFHPVGLQAAAGLEEIGSGGEAIVSRVAGGVTFQAGRGGAAEEAARHFGFLGGQDGNLFWNVVERLPRQGLEDTHQFAQLVFGEREGGSPYSYISSRPTSLLECRGDNPTGDTDSWREEDFPGCPRGKW